MSAVAIDANGLRTSYGGKSPLQTAPDSSLAPGAQ